jgi:hypothetical protein
MSNFNASTFAQAVGSAPDPIGYDRGGATAFRRGWNAALDLVYRMEQEALADSIVEDLGLDVMRIDRSYRDY